MNTRYKIISVTTTALMLAFGFQRVAAQTRINMIVVSSFSCPFCRTFHAQSKDELESFWKKKGLTIETVNLEIGPVDDVLTAASQCGASNMASKRTTSLFVIQPIVRANWDEQIQLTKDAANNAAARSDLRAKAKASGIYNYSNVLGVNEQTLRTCMGNTKSNAAAKAHTKAIATRWNVSGTPTIIINDKLAGHAWISVKRALIETSSGVAPKAG